MTPFDKNETMTMEKRLSREANDYSESDQPAAHCSYVKQKKDTLSQHNVPHKNKSKVLILKRNSAQCKTKHSAKREIDGFKHSCRS